MSTIFILHNTKKAFIFIYEFSITTILDCTFTMKIIITLLVLGLCPLYSYSQNNIEIISFPKDMQLLPRNKNTNKANYNISGKILPNSGFSELLLKIYKSESIYKETTYPLSNNTSTASFLIPFEINAELSNYTLELYGKKNNDLTLLKKATKVVAGDVFIINGQSNNIGSITPSDEDEFLRSYTEQFSWNKITYTQPSLWAPRLAKNIIEKHRIPIALFNESYGGVRIDYFLKNDIDPYSGNYGTLLKRLEKAEVKNNIRTIIWWQGESDGWETSLESYKSQFKKLHAAWQKDYNRPNIYLFQIRFQSCTHPKPYVLEAQRQLSNDIEGLGIISTNAAKSDGCHFYYTGGYDSLGNRMYRLIASDIYNAPKANTASPDIDKAWFSKPNEITIQMKNVTGNLVVLGSPWNDFRLETSSNFSTDSLLDATIKGKVLGNQIILEFEGDSSYIKGVSYLGHIHNANDWIVNLQGTSILSFFNIPILKQAPSTPNTEGVASFEISPTIGYDFVNLKWAITKAGNKKIYFYNLQGQTQLFKTINKEEKSIKIDISALPEGIYIVLLEEEGKRSSYQKFIKL